MEKLLHERLRELENWCQLYKRYNIREVSFTKLMESFADEIERYYIPRPRFEDGKPVQFGDCFMHSNGNQDVVSSIHFSETYAYINSKGSSGRVRKEDFVKRPAPKVYDADGVEIKVGDTVYDEKGKEYTVTDYCSSKDCVIADNSDGEGYHLMGYLYTHDKPVVDAEGVRICKGDTVWHVNGSNPFKVISVDSSSVFVRDESIPSYKGGCIFDGYSLTHKEPDSIQSVIDYVRKLADDSAYNEDELNEIADRLTAIMGRDD